MNLVYREVEDVDTAQLLLESVGDAYDRAFAKSGGFAIKALESLRGAERELPARELPPLGLEGVIVSGRASRPENGHWRHEFDLQPPKGNFRIQLVIPGAAELQAVYLDGQLALDSSRESKHSRTSHAIVLNNAGIRPFHLELVTDNGGPFQVKAASWFDFPVQLHSAYAGIWPGDARNFDSGSASVMIQQFGIGSK
jgi:hypothetical protein